MNELLYYVIHFVLKVAAFFFFARFLLQACRVDFYNPLSQGIVKLTDPVLKPLRMVVPSFRNLDFAAFLMAWATHVLVLVAATTLGGGYVNVVGLIALGLQDTLLLCINIFYVAIFVVIIASFIAPGTYHPALTLLHQITQPLLAPAQRVIPSVGGFDLSPLLVFLVLGAAEIVIHKVFASLF